MPNTVITIKKSATPAAAPSSLANGELALNFADGILYYKRANGTIGTISGTGGGGGASSYGIVNANGTLLLAGIPTDTFSILPGQNITIVGDAINDRVTIGADLSPANNWANTKLANTSGVSFSGNLFFPNGNVAVGASSATFNSVAYRLYVNGAFAANTKSFVIDHPTKPGLKLQHGSLEGPENGVYVRGKLDGVKVIQLPDYWEGLVDLSTITVQLTAIGHAQNLYVVAIDGLKVHIDTENHTQPYCYYTVHGERKDVNKLIVEY